MKKEKLPEACPECKGTGDGPSGPNQCIVCGGDGLKPKIYKTTAPSRYAFENMPRPLKPPGRRP